MGDVVVVENEEDAAVGTIDEENSYTGGFSVGFFTGPASEESHTENSMKLES